MKIASKGPSTVAVNARSRDPSGLKRPSRRPTLSTLRFSFETVNAVIFVITGGGASVAVGLPLTVTAGAGWLAHAAPAQATQSSTAIERLRGMTAFTPFPCDDEA